MMFPPDPCPTAHRKHPETSLPWEEGVDPNVLENSNAFGAEQTWPTEDELKNKMVADEYKDMDMDEPEPMEAEVGPVAPESSQEPTTDDGLGGLTQQMQSMTINVIGESEEQPVEEEVDDFDFPEDVSYDDSKVSMKHKMYTDLEQRAKDDMDFRDEVDTPLDETA